jgi:DAK2 domain fusion protein YloV
VNNPRRSRTESPAQSRAVWNGEALLDAMASATTYLSNARDEVNALNVFPVPDGDTGTNMAMTMRSAPGAARERGGDARRRAGAVAHRLAFGGLPGARGNSGVILSQIFRGFATPIAELDEIDGRDFAKALASASAMAYKAVMKPVEGTMLSVIRGAAERAEQVAARTPSLPTTLDAAVTGATAALAKTPQQLPILKQAGVVDAGGHGVVLILQALRDYARGEEHAAPAASVNGPAPVGASMAFLDKIDELHEADVFGYCTNFMVFGNDIDFDRAREEIAAMGQSAVIVGDSSMIKVHIHTEHPGQVLEYAVGLGDLDQIKIDNMTQQSQTLEAQRAEARAAEPNGLSPDTAPATKQAILAVASGDGVSDALRSMGASGIIPGGQTMNPSTEEMLAAVNATAGDEVLLLPNNKNILMAAQQVPMLTDKQVRIVPTRSIAQGLASLAAYNDEAGLQANLEAMTHAATTVTTVELTQAVRDVLLRGIKVATGQVIGLLDEDLVAAGANEIEVLGETLSTADRPNAELVTIFSGEGVSEDDTNQVERTVADMMPEAEIEVHPGGQPHYRFIISIE